MQYVSRVDLETLAALKDQGATLTKQSAATERRRILEKDSFVHRLVSFLLLAVVCVLAWFYTQFQALKLLYPIDTDWFRTRYVLGPRPRGEAHVDLSCLLTSAEYPVFARAFLRMCVPQTSAIFILTMLQSFGDHLEGIHYSGDREQLRADRLPEFLKSFSGWNHEDNPWRFLFPDASSFERSVAVEKARKGGATMLGTLFEGGLCLVATQWYRPDIDAPTMCRELLDEHVVYYQSCAATRRSNAVSTGANAGIIAAGVAALVMSFFTFGLAGAAEGVALAATEGGIELADLSATGAAEGAAEGVGESTLDAGGQGVGSALKSGAKAVAKKVASGTRAVAKQIASVPKNVASGARAMAQQGVKKTAISGLKVAGRTAYNAAPKVVAGAAVGGVSTAIAYAAQPCPYDQYYTLQKTDKGYKKVAWGGDPKDLPKRARSADQSARPSSKSN